MKKKERRSSVQRMEKRLRRNTKLWELLKEQKHKEIGGKLAENMAARLKRKYRTSVPAIKIGDGRETLEKTVARWARADMSQAGGRVGGEGKLGFLHVTGNKSDGRKKRRGKRGFFKSQKTHRVGTRKRRQGRGGDGHCVSATKTNDLPGEKKKYAAEKKWIPLFCSSA